MRKQSVLMDVRRRHVTDIASVSGWDVNSATTGNLNAPKTTVKLSPRATKASLGAERSITSTKKVGHGLMFNNSTGSNVFMTPKNAFKEQALQTIVIDGKKNNKEMGAQEYFRQALLDYGEKKGQGKVP